MKYLQTYSEQSELCNESLRDKMTPVSDEEIINKLKDKNYPNHPKIISHLFYDKKIDLLKSIINDKDVNISPEGLNELLSLSCNHGYTDLVKLCIEKGVDIQQSYNSIQGVTDLLVISHKYDDILKILVDAGLDPKKTIQKAEDDEYYNHVGYYETIIELIKKFNLEDEFEGIIDNYEKYYKPNM